MGNRAIITSTKKDIAVYLHWNGDRDSVEAFLAYCKLRGFRAPETDDYGYARLVQVIANYMGADGLSVGVMPYPGDEVAADVASDNGVYVTEDWEITERVYPWDDFEEETGSPLDYMLKDVDVAQPTDQQLGAFLDAEVVPTSELEIGDRVFFHEADGRYAPHEIVGFGSTGKVVNGHDVGGVPYALRYDSPYLPANENCNNYVLADTARRVPR